MRTRLAAAVLLPAVAGAVLAAAPAQADTGRYMPVARTFTGIAELGGTAEDAYRVAQETMRVQSSAEDLVCVERSHTEYRIAFSGHWVSTVQAECFGTSPVA